MILHFEIKQTNNKPYISNQRAVLRCDAGVGRDKSHLITTTSHLITTPRSIYLLLNAFLFYFNNSTAQEMFKLGVELICFQFLKSLYFTYTQILVLSI